MNLNKYKNKKLSELTEKEKQEWNKFVEKNQELLKIMKLLIKIDKKKKCLMCKTKFPDGILNKYPNKVVSFGKLIKSDFLFHMQSTHGISPISFIFMLKDCVNKVGK